MADINEGNANSIFDSQAADLAGIGFKQLHDEAFGDGALFGERFGIGAGDKGGNRGGRALKATDKTRHDGFGDLELTASEMLARESSEESVVRSPQREGEQRVETRFEISDAHNPLGRRLAC